MPRTPWAPCSRIFMTSLCGPGSRFGARGGLLTCVSVCIYRIDGAVHAVIGSRRSGRANAIPATRVLLFRAASGATFARPRCGRFGSGWRWGRPRAGAPVPAADDAAGWDGWPLLVPAALRQRQRASSVGERWGWSTGDGARPAGGVSRGAGGAWDHLYFFFFLVAIATLHMHALRPLAQRGKMSESCVCRAEPTCSTAVTRRHPHHPTGKREEESSDRKHPSTPRTTNITARSGTRTDLPGPHHARARRRRGHRTPHPPPPNHPRPSLPRAPRAY